MLTTIARRTILSASPAGKATAILDQPEAPSQRLIELAREMTAILRGAPCHNHWRVVVDPVAGRVVLEGRR